MNPSNNILYVVKPGDTLFNLSRQYNTTVEAIMKSNPKIDFRNISVNTGITIPGDTTKYSKQDLKNVLRELWEQHVAWTRMTIISEASDNPDLNPTVNRLLRNSSDMAEALKPFYGEAQSTKFGDLVNEHLKIALQLVLAAKMGDSSGAEAAEKKWYANADEIADYIHQINPYISAEAFRQMFHEHLAMTKGEAVARLSKDYHTDIALYDQIENQALKMADVMADGIIRQFPQLF